MGKRSSEKGQEMDTTIDRSDDAQTEPRPAYLASVPAMIERERVRMNLVVAIVQAGRLEAAWRRGPRTPGVPRRGHVGGRTRPAARTNGQPLNARRAI
jgi:hypothetical protein